MSRLLWILATCVARDPRCEDNRIDFIARVASSFSNGQRKLACLREVELQLPMNEWEDYLQILKDYLIYLT